MKKIISVISICLLVTSIAKAQHNPSSLTFNTDSTFKIVQFTDIHYKTDSEESKKSLKMIENVLTSEKPDLVVFTGDIVTCKPQKQGWDEVLASVINHHIPYAVVFGNHDDEYDWTRDEIMTYITSKPYCVAQKGTEQIKGVGNYILKIKDKNNKNAALLYCMDSHAYSVVNNQKGYGFFDFSQVDWYKENSAHFTSKNNNTPLPALAFFHIPLQEYTLLSDSTKNYVKPRTVFGTKKEKECPGILNTGMFAAMVQSGDVMGTFVGHDHNNDYIGYLNGICLAYGRFSGSKTTYTNIGYGARVIELKQGERTFNTWIRNEANETIYSVKYPDDFLKKE